MVTRTARPMPWAREPRRDRVLVEVGAVVQAEQHERPRRCRVQVLHRPGEHGRDGRSFVVALTQQFQAPLLARIENHGFTAASRLNSPRDRQFRRRLLRTVVDLRNLG